MKTVDLKMTALTGLLSVRGKDPTGPHPIASAQLVNALTEKRRIETEYRTGTLTAPKATEQLRNIAEVVEQASAALPDEAQAVMRAVDAVLGTIQGVDDDPLAQLASGAIDADEAKRRGVIL